MPVGSAGKVSPIMARSRPTWMKRISLHSMATLEPGPATMPRDRKSLMRSNGSATSLRSTDTPTR